MHLDPDSSSDRDNCQAWCGQKPWAERALVTRELCRKSAKSLVNTGTEMLLQGEFLQLHLCFLPLPGHLSAKPASPCKSLRICCPAGGGISSRRSRLDIDQRA